MATVDGADGRGARLRRLAGRGLTVAGVGAGLWLAGQLTATAAAEEHRVAGLLTGTTGAVAELAAEATTPVLDALPPVADLAPPALRPEVSGVAAPIVETVTEPVVGLLDRTPAAPVVDSVVPPVVDLVVGGPAREALPAVDVPAVPRPTPIARPAVAPAAASSPLPAPGAAAGSAGALPAERPEGDVLAPATPAVSVPAVAVPAVAVPAVAVPKATVPTVTVPVPDAAAQESAPPLPPMSPSLPPAAVPAPCLGSGSGTGGGELPSAASTATSASPVDARRLPTGGRDSALPSSPAADPSTSPD